MRKQKSKITRSANINIMMPTLFVVIEAFALKGNNNWRGYPTRRILFMLLSLLLLMPTLSHADIFLNPMQQTDWSYAGVPGGYLTELLR